MITQGVIEVHGKFHAVIVVDGERRVGRMGYSQECSARMESRHMAERVVLEAVEKVMPQNTKFTNQKAAAAGK